MENLQILELLSTSAYMAYSSSFTPSEELRSAYCARISRPQIGDVVIEISTKNRISAIDRIGVLISHEKNIYVIKTTDEREIEWNNASFIVIPDEKLARSLRNV